MQLSSRQWVCQASVQRCLSLGGRLTVKTQAGLHSRPSVKRVTALKISLSLKFLAIQNLQILPLRAWSVLGVCQVWPWWNFHMPEVFWSAIGKKSSVWNAFCLAVVALSKIPMKLVYWKQHYERWKAKPSCLHCLSISMRLKEVARPSWFSLRTNTFFFPSAMLVLWLMLFFFWVLSQRIKKL